MTEATALCLDGVRRCFRIGGRTVTALEDVSLSVRAGRITGLVGADGAGKTTVMRIAAALLAPDGGGVRVFDIDAVREPLAVQSVVGYMPQRFGLYEDLTVQENLELYAGLQGVPQAERPARYAELERMTGLAPFRDRLAGRLSGGMKQKLGLACALIRPRRLLLLDEPTVGVDPVSRRELWAIIDRLVREQSMAVLLSTAYLDEAERCDEVVLLHEGRVLAAGAPRALAEAVAGRAFEVRADAAERRSAQRRLLAVPGVIDALILGERLRVLTVAPGRPDAHALAEAVGGASVTPVPPRFEDAFIARLHGQAGMEPQQGAPRLELDAAAAGGAGEEVIVCRNVRRRFGDFWAVKGVSFRVRRGEVFGLLGANGAGKSTLFRMLCGLLPLTDGEARVAGVDLHHARAEARARIGYMAQRFSLYGDLSVRQNLEFFAAAYGLPPRRARQRIAWAQRVFALAAYAEHNARDLPLGFQQRLALAAALMHEPAILFLDEPTSGVDPLARRGFWRWINALAEAGVTVLVTTHFMEEAEYCDRMIIMADGEVLAEGSPQAIKHAAASERCPEPTMEDAFVSLIRQRAQSAQEAAA